jgi:4-amino-4-deoxy-L-arabinose transferase-like glycosyltransferase
MPVSTFLSPLLELPLAFYGRVIDALSDPARRNRAMLLLAAVYAACWTLYASIAKSSQALNADMAEMAIWGQNLAWGYPKHPPLLGWIVGAWFAVFPHADWAYYLLSGLTLGAGLYLSFLLAGEWLDGVKRALVPFLLALIPFYNFLGLKFDQNSALIPLWALTIWAFLRALETRAAGWAALAGAAAAAAVLTKYWSVFLLLALAMAALSDPRRERYFRSSAPWITALVGAAAIAPHAIWLFREQFQPVTWVTSRRLASSLFDALRALSEYAFGTLGYAAIALAVVLIFLRPSWAAWRAALIPRDSPRRTAAIVFWLPLLVPVAVSFIAGVNLLSLWNTPALALLPVLLLSPPSVTVTRRAASFIVGAAVTFTLVPLLLSPFIARTLLHAGVENDAVYARSAAGEIERQWHSATPAPLKIVAGPFALVSAAAFYTRDRANTFADFSAYLSPWVGADAIARDGAAVICPLREQFCLAEANRLAARNPESRLSEIAITPRWFGYVGEPARFLITIVPPRR